MLQRSTEVILQREAKLHAPLAQLVERFHGKEEVFGSNPEGGSVSWWPCHLRLEFGGAKLPPLPDQGRYTRRLQEEAGEALDCCEAAGRRSSTSSEARGGVAQLVRALDS